MKKETWFLKLALLGLGLPVVLVCILALPNLYQDAYRAFPDKWVTPIMVVMYASVLPYLYALVQAFRLLSLIDHQNAFSMASVKAIQHIKYCALSISAAYVITLPFFYLIADIDDAPGFVLIGIALVGAPFVVSVFAAVLQKLLNQAIQLKSENDLTI